MLVLFVVVDSKLLAQVGLEKDQQGSTSTVRNKYDSILFSVRCLVLLAYWEGIDFLGLSISCGTPQAIGILSHHPPQ